jgi:hypothetical protein
VRYREVKEFLKKGLVLMIPRQALGSVTILDRLDFVLGQKSTVFECDLDGPWVL